MDTPTAALIAEGAREASEAQTREAWSNLIGTGACWELQGWFGRHAMALIGHGEFAEDGTDLNPVED